MTLDGQTSPGRTIALVYNTDVYLHRLRGGLLRALKVEGYKVYAIAPPGPAENSWIVGMSAPVAARLLIAVCLMVWGMTSLGLRPARMMQRLKAVFMSSM